MSVRVLESVTLVVLLGFVLKWGVSLYPYSGAGKPPMYGDYEAQRHWQEITFNLDVKTWYSNSSKNDLMYWGLDYPPLTAYHSYIVGYVANKINPAYVQLNKSRGYESYDHKLFMRYSVFLSDLLVFIPAVLFYLKLANSNILSSKVGNQLNFIALILCPSLILIDYGHFQYNNVSLGLFIAAVTAVTTNLDCLGSVLFCLALNYKQMELYHALPFFFYLLGKSFREPTYQKSALKLLTVGGSVLFTFFIIWLPYLQSSDLFLQVVNRVFPLNRGLFEDKVASIWCSLSVLIKFKEIFDQSTMALICLLSTSLACIPSCVNLFMYPTAERFKYSLVNVSFVFFLFSYHVHEKSILLVIIPACLMFGSEPYFISWFSVIAQLSMLPLLNKDGLFIPYVSLTIMTVFLYNFVKSFCVVKRHQTLMDVFHYADKIDLLFKCSMVVTSVLTLLLKFGSPPDKYPDLFPVLISIYSCLHFILFAIFFHMRQFSLPSSEQILRKSKIN